MVVVTVDSGANAEDSILHALRLNSKPTPSHSASHAATTLTGITTTPISSSTTMSPEMMTSNTGDDEDENGDERVAMAKFQHFALTHPFAPGALYDDDGKNQAEAGPSTPWRAIPPPPSPRRHRSGVLMSRVRANSGGGPLKETLPMGSSKSWGDLSILRGLAMSSGGAGAGEAETIESEPRNESVGKRVLSDGSRCVDEAEDATFYDNSARFYHKHSQAASRSASRSTSPTRSNLSVSPVHVQPPSSSSSPIFIRHNLTHPHPQPNNNNSNNHQLPPPPGAAMSSSISPNHHFLQQHLPPTFPHVEPRQISPETLLQPENPFHHSMVILTPTTDQWRELKELGRLEGEEVTISGESDDSDDSSPESTAGQGLLLQAPSPSRPSLTHKSISVDYLAKEVSHTPDPGMSDTMTQPVEIVEQPSTPERLGRQNHEPHFNVIAPSPVVIPSDTVPDPPISPDNLSPDRYTSIVLDEDHPITVPIDHDAIPVRFHSIGRNSAVRAINRTQTTGPRVKTKREREREALFKAMDEEIAGGIDDKDSSAGWGIQEIGSGKGLSSPPLGDQVMSEKMLDNGVPLRPHPAAVPVRSNSTPAALPAPLLTHSLPPTIISPTLPVKPSPLNSTPLTAEDNSLPAVSSEDNTPIDESPTLDLDEGKTKEPTPETETQRYEAIRNYARAMSTRHTVYPRDSNNTVSGASANVISGPEGILSSSRSPRRRDTNRVSLVAGRVVQPFAFQPPIPSMVSRTSSSLQSFSPFRSPVLDTSKPTVGGVGSSSSSSGQIPPFPRFDSSVSFAPSTGAPSECGTPTSETAGGVGGRGIDDYVILSEAGKGAYGLVMRAKVKGPRGEPVGDEVIIKYIIKARILADCWKKHKVLGPIPVEIHVMDQLRHIIYHLPPRPHPWDPFRPRDVSSSPVPRSETPGRDGIATPDTPNSLRSDSSLGIVSPAQRYIAEEIKQAPERGHPNICKLLDFFEDREFYYLVMPRYGTGVDLFDRVESQPSGLDPFEVRTLLGQLTDAVRFLHANGIVHRDIKDENVILDGSGRCQLIDFGSAAHWRPGKRWDTFSGTLHYASPEILRGEMYGGKEQDIWALGVVAYVLLVGETPFSDLPDEVFVALSPNSRAEAALEARCGGIHANEGLEIDGGGCLGDAADLVRRCLEVDQNDRPSAEELLEHRYLKGEGGWTGFRAWEHRGTNVEEEGKRESNVDMALKVNDKLVE